MHVYYMNVLSSLAAGTPTGSSINYVSHAMQKQIFVVVIQKEGLAGTTLT